MWPALIDLFWAYLINPFSLHHESALYPSNCGYCSFDSIYPKTYIAYKVQPYEVKKGNQLPLLLDGNINEPFWNAVPFTENFVDISTTTIPKFQTKAKIRYDDTYLYIAAMINDTAIWANITHTCHCISSTENQVIFTDNDFEVFVDPAGTNHYYKEYEMNAANATWDLQLNKPYSDSGYENSSRVFGPYGWDMQPPLRCATLIKGMLNNPKVNQTSWSVEIAMPLSSLVENQGVNTKANPNPYSPADAIPPASGVFWRINFSRVEWNVVIVGNHYVKDPACQR